MAREQEGCKTRVENVLFEYNVSEIKQSWVMMRPHSYEDEVLRENKDGTGH